MSGDLDIQHSPGWNADCRQARSLPLSVSLSLALPVRALTLSFSRLTRATYLQEEDGPKPEDCGAVYLNWRFVYALLVQSGARSFLASDMLLPLAP